MHATALFVHSLIGALALAAFWIAALSRKGSRPHRLAGRTYIWTMAGILLSALPLVWSIFASGNTSGGLFFAYLLILVGSGVVTGPRAVRLKLDFAAYRSGVYPWLAWAQLLGGAGVALVGARTGASLLAVFGGVGVALSLRMLALRRKNSAPAGWWLREHFTAMGGNGIATHVAFFSIGLMHLLPQELALRMQQAHFGWFAPLLIGSASISWLTMRHKRRFAARHPAATLITNGESAKGELA
jgi:uncharacterized membrane protein